MLYTSQLCQATPETVSPARLEERGREGRIIAAEVSIPMSFRLACGGTLLDCPTRII